MPSIFSSHASSTTATNSTPQTQIKPHEAPPLLGCSQEAYMQFRAAKSLWRKFLLLRYSIPRAMSTMNFTSVCTGICWGAEQQRETSLSKSEWHMLGAAVKTHWGACITCWEYLGLSAYSSVLLRHTLGRQQLTAHVRLVPAIHKARLSYQRLHVQARSCKCLSGLDLLNTMTRSSTIL